MSDKQKSDMKFSDIMSGEGSGIEKFDHTKHNVMEALNVTEQDYKRIQSVLRDFDGITSKKIEEILLSDKLHNTKERIVAGYIFGEVSQKTRNFERRMRDLMGDMPPTD